jgi:hypothetical protein
MTVNITIDGEEYSISGDYQPAEGDGWNEPYYSDSFNVYAIKDAYGKEVSNWKDYWTEDYLEKQVLFELAYQKFLDESDEPFDD